MQFTDGHWEAVVIFTKHVYVHLCVFGLKEAESDAIISCHIYIFQIWKKSKGKSDHRPCVCDRSLYLG